LDIRQKKQKAFAYLKKHWSDKNGITVSCFFDVPDLDTMAVAFRVLGQNGVKLNPAVFKKFTRTSVA